MRYFGRWFGHPSAKALALAVVVCAVPAIHAAAQLALGSDEGATPFTGGLLHPIPGAAELQHPRASASASERCVEDAYTLCLQGNRFRVTADWLTVSGQAGRAMWRNLPGPAAGYAWFFDETNVEILVKVLDGCAINGRHWVFAAGLTNLQVTMTVADTLSNETQVYGNLQGSLFQPVQDLDAFSSCEAASANVGSQSSADRLALPLHDARCELGDEVVCLGSRRFEVQTRWETSEGRSGTGKKTNWRAGDTTGAFWFFEPGNLEVVVKILDGCAVNDHWWVFAAGLTDVGVEMTVTDWHNAETKTWRNPLSRPFAPVQDVAAFPCSDGGVDAGETRATAKGLELGHPVAGRLGAVDDVDYYRVNASGSGVLTVWTAGVYEGQGYDADTAGVIEDSSGLVLGGNDDAAPNGGFLFDAVLPRPGAYYVRVTSGASGSVGRYLLRASLALDRERTALEEFYRATGGPNWIRNDGWLRGPIGETDWLDRDPGWTWHGVALWPDGRVRHLILHENNLAGFVPDTIAALSALEYLGLTHNRLIGSIPESIGRLSGLTGLDLRDNRLSGPIPPELGDLSELTHLILARNQLSGEIPWQLGRLFKLRSLGLDENQLTGPIPPELGRLTGLGRFWLNSNNLTGPIPRELGRLTSLRDLYLQNNWLSGPLPSELGRLSNLRSLWLHNTFLSGPLPRELTDLELSQFYWYGTSLCAPTDRQFVDWLRTIESASGPIC